MRIQEAIRQTIRSGALVLFIMFIQTIWTQNANAQSLAPFQSQATITQPTPAAPPATVETDAEREARIQRWTDRRRGLRQETATPQQFSWFRFSDIGVVITIITVVGGTLHRYLLRSIKKELGDFQLNLFNMLDQRYVSISANQMHIQNDQREHDQLRREMGALAGHLSKIEEAMLFNTNSRPRA